MNRIIPYYNPNLQIVQLLQAFCVRHAQEKCVRFYKEYSGKEYILLTDSCRTALLLAYKVLLKNSGVLTSPLVCKVALAPIVESGNRVVFSDIENKTWNLNPKKLPDRLPDSIKAIQLTHFGGVPGDVEELIGYARAHGLLIIEDCAQGFGSVYHGKPLGTFGDVVCFSGIKTAYGISGGVLATNDKSVYDRACALLAPEKNESRWLSAYRALRNCIDSYRSSSALAQSLYSGIMKMRPSKKNKDVVIKMKQSSRIAMKIWAHQLERVQKLHSQRVESAQRIRSSMDKDLWQSNYQGEETTVLTKLYLRHSSISSFRSIEKLNRIGMETMHLQQKYSSYYQDSLHDSIWLNAMVVGNGLKNFEKIHDEIISIPLYERMKEEYIIKLREILHQYEREEKDNMV